MLHRVGPQLRHAAQQVVVEFLKRQMYGRVSVELLRLRVLGPN
jgi:hypothetical protein